MNNDLDSFCICDEGADYGFGNIMSREEKLLFAGDDHTPLFIQRNNPYQFELLAILDILI